MRITASLLLIAVLMFNWFGYQVLYNFLEHKEDQYLEALLDQGKYNDDELIAIKIPLFLPYILDQSEFQRAYGQVTIEGIQYKYVKRRVMHDSLTLLCIADKEKMRLKDARNDYFKRTVDIQRPDTNKSKGHQSKFRGLLGEFDLKFHYWDCSYCSTPTAFVLTNQTFLTLLVPDKTEHPPEHSI